METSKIGYKTLWEKEKLLVTSNLSFSDSDLKRLVQQTRKKQGLVWGKVKAAGCSLDYLAQPHCI